MPIELENSEICVIGGSRYFGKRLITRLLARGARVTVLNRGSSPAPPGTEHLTADRDDEAALEAALGDRRFDAVIDQVCYTPRQAAVARRVFGPRTGRYLMTSTVQVYEYEHSAAPVPESAIDPRTVEVDVNRPWDAPGYVDDYYGVGKRQAEAVFARDPALPYVSVRVAHVLGGDDDFTGRLAHYVERVRDGEPIAVPINNQPATYVHVEEIADFLLWSVEQDFTGPVNANSHGELTTEDICAALARLTGRTPVFRPVEVGDVSPLSFAYRYPMDNSRATQLGYAFRRAEDWLPEVAAEALALHAENAAG